VFQQISREKRETLLQPKPDQASAYQIGLAHVTDPLVYLSNSKKVSTKEKAIPYAECSFSKQTRRRNQAQPGLSSMPSMPSEQETSLYLDRLAAYKTKERVQ